MLESDRTQSVDLDGSLSPVGALAEGTVVGGRYVLRGVLGKGGYAYVYRAFDNQLRHETALKILRPEPIGPTPRARLRREAAVAREVESPHLVRIFDVALGEELNYLTMELVEGGSLSDLLRAGPLAIERSREILEQSLEGLAALHANGIAQRDVKPGNILLTGSGTVKLADFGLALRWGSDETRATVGDAVVGTVDYLAPEQFLGQDADEQSDLYSLGVVAFEMLTGELPRRGASALGTMIGHLKNDAPDVRALRPEIPRSLAEIVRGLLERSRRQRYHSAAAVLADLRAGTLLAAGALFALSRFPRFSHLVAMNGNAGIETVAVGRRGEITEYDGQYAPTWLRTPRRVRTCLWWRSATRDWRARRVSLPKRAPRCRR